MHDSRVPSGNGQYHNQNHTNRKGEPNPHARAGQPYDTISLEELKQQVANPVICAKADAPWMLASTYHQCDARTFSVQEKSGQYAYFLGDVDKGNKSLEEVKAAVGTVLPGVHVLINSTSTATVVDKRWHFTVPVDVRMPYRAFLPYQTVFFRALEAQGLQMDGSLTRAAQLFFLPSKVHSGSFYEWAEMPGVAYAASQAVGPLTLSSIIADARPKPRFHHRQPRRQTRCRLRTCGTLT